MKNIKNAIFENGIQKVTEGIISKKNQCELVLRNEMTKGIPYPPPLF
ncbi:MAG: hypothetical protein ACUZ8I_13030 [Candidatus Scalindua sp.]